MHQAAFDFVAEVVALHGPFDTVIEIGARNVNGSVRELFGECDYLATDVADGPGVEQVISGADLTVDTPVDCVVCCEVLEHTDQAVLIVRNMVRLLRSGGVGIITCAGEGRAAHSAVHGGPLQPGEFYANVTAENIIDWLGADVTDTFVSPAPTDTRVAFRKV